MTPPPLSRPDPPAAPHAEGAGTPVLDLARGARVSIVTGSYGAGHDAAARELATHLRDAGCAVTVHDIADLLPVRLGAVLRSAGQPAPVLFLTALGAMHDRLAGFSAGADDYLPKPFDVKELIARVEALTKRGRIVTAESPGDLVLDPARHAIVCKGKEVLLTPTEFRMLAAITSRPGEVVRRRAIVAAAWPDGAMVSENTIDTYVRRLRVKLAEIDSPVHLQTVRGVGLTLR